ncbi:hypothetical protein DFH94DRAFT_707120 [Russula ochroleuca]|uniref:C3H1-type domain-containing protein n=1 Tax=Russula ochroleuca TaxID=152965 RepID=A0A9P5TDA5_9AGAM|nr:hypothetical protein DFH94DRAFT_707120 [Russula ochroleuca]
MPPALPVQGPWQPQGSPPTARTALSGPFSSRMPMPPHPSPLDQEEPKPVTPAGVVSQHPQATSIAPKKEDMAYKTTPCRHFTLNQGWCPWGDDCGFIHDPDLEWVPASERTSGRSTPNSTLGGNKSLLHEKTMAESEIDIRRSVSSKSAHCWGYIQGVCPHSETCKYLHPADIVPYIKYTPCLTWPRCGYPALACPLKHPQVDKLTPPRRSQPPSAPSTTTIVPQGRSGIAPRAETYSNTLPPPRLQSRLLSMPMAPLTPVGGLVIPHDEAYASARLHHRPTIPSAEMFTPAPARPVVRLRRPSEDVPRDQALEMQYGLGMGAYQGRARSVSIAVQRLNEEFSGPVLQTQAKAFARGHGRGKSLNL